MTSVTQSRFGAGAEKACRPSRPRGGEVGRGLPNLPGVAAAAAPAARAGRPKALLAHGPAHDLLGDARALRAQPRPYGPVAPRAAELLEGLPHPRAQRRVLVEARAPAVVAVGAPSDPQKPENRGLGQACRRDQSPRERAQARGRRRSRQRASRF